MKHNKYRITLWVGGTPFSKGCKTVGDVIHALEAAVGKPMDERQQRAVIGMAVALYMDGRTAECDLTSDNAPMRVSLAYIAA